MQLFLVDANVFVAAIKNPEKKAGALDLMSHLIKRLKEKMVAVEVDGNNIKKCSEYFPKNSAEEEI